MKHRLAILVWFILPIKFLIWRITKMLYTVPIISNYFSNHETIKYSVCFSTQSHTHTDTHNSSTLLFRILSNDFEKIIISKG